MFSKRKRLLPAFSILLLAACTAGQNTVLNEQKSNDQDQVIGVNHNVEEHPAWNESPAEPVIGEFAVEVPRVSKKEENKGK